jgi:thiol-disulfide isomerase/thioredoxin
MYKLHIVILLLFAHNLDAQNKIGDPRIDMILQRSADKWESEDKWSFQHTYKYIDKDYTDTMRIESDIVLVRSNANEYGYELYSVFRDNECMIFDGRQLMYGLLDSDTMRVARRETMDMMLEHSFAKNVRFPSFSKKRNWSSILNRTNVALTECERREMNGVEYYMITIHNVPNQSIISAKRELLVRCEDSMLTSNSEYMKRIDEGDTVDQRRITEINNICTGEYVDVDRFYERYNIYEKIMLPEDTSLHSRGKEHLVGKTAAQHILKDTDGDAKSVPTPGKIAIVDFWYEYCPPCERLLHSLPGLVTEFDPERVDFLLVNVGSNPRIDKIKQKFEIFRDNRPFLIGNADIIRDYEVTAYPTIVIVDENGTISTVEYGYDEETIDTIRTSLLDLLNDGQH